MNSKDRDKWKLLEKFKESLIPPCEFCRLRENESLLERQNKYGQFAKVFYQTCNDQEKCEEFINFRKKYIELNRGFLDHGVYR